MARPKMQRVEINCKYCGVAFLVKESRKNKTLYCCREHYILDAKAEPTKKICPACGTEFLTGGRDLPRHTQVYCSVDCSGEDSSTQPYPRTLSNPEAAWLACAIDGEGTLVTPQKRYEGNIRVAVYNTDRRFVDRCFELAGTGRVFERDRGNPKHAVAYNWQCTGRNARLLLEQLVLWLIIKRERAERVLGAWAERKGKP